MKIALIGNNNNNLNALTRYLRDAGHDAHLFLFNDDPDHFHPSRDCFDDSYKAYTHRLSWGSYKSYFTSSKKQLQKDLEPYPFLIGSKLAPAFAKKAGRRLNIFIPTGGEIWTLPFFAGWHYKELIKYLLFSKIQKKAIMLNVDKLLFDYTNADVEEKIKNLGFDTATNRFFNSPPFIYLPEFSKEKIDANTHTFTNLGVFKNLRINFDTIIFHHSSHWWKNIHKDQHHDKGNDILFRGLAKYIKKGGTLKTCIVTIGYGPDFEKTKTLIRELEIEKEVFWLDHQPRKSIFNAIRKSDIVAGEFKNSWFSYGAIFEGLTMAVPVLHHRNDTLYKDRPEGLYPMLHAQNPEDICAVLERLAAKTVDLKLIGQESHDWFLKNAIEKPLDIIIKEIEANSLYR